MALQLARPTKFGAAVTASYWRVTALSIDVIARSSRVELTGYASASAAAAGASPMEAITYVWEGDEFPFDLTSESVRNPLTIAYRKIGAIGDWGAAKDV